MKDGIFKEIIKPILPILEEEANKIKGDNKKYSLSLYPFTINLLFGIIEGIKSISQLSTFIKTSQNAEELNLVKASKSMYSESFDRYSVGIFKRMFSFILGNLNFMEIPEIKSLGRFYLTDGSIFPAIKTMAWATYKKRINAIKLHLSFELNRMIPVSFISTEANYSEKKALLAMISKGITFIADRGYLKFKLFKQIIDKGAHFIIRGKTNMLFSIVENLTIKIPKEFGSMISSVSDRKVIFTNDPSKTEYRLVSFYAMDELYNLTTDRFDLTTFEVIMLYAYRWQVELIFRFLKRTLNALHLMNTTANGIEIQFILYMICYLLLLNKKQEFNIIAKASSETTGYKNMKKTGSPQNYPVTFKKNMIL